MKWFRFHLLTLVVMSLVAGGFLLANLREWLLGYYLVRGWPYYVCGYDITSNNGPVYVWNFYHIALNLIVLIVAMGAVIFVMEYWVYRKRVAPKPAEESDRAGGE